MEHSSSSKVTVEYHDPSGVFPLIARELANRLPLRNLNWQSSARPLRQIKHLHVEFIPDPETEAILRPPPGTQANNYRPTSIDILRSGGDAQKGNTKLRRHQIPGLKTTPYLRLYILRCDDKNWYKQEERQKLKAWVREVAPGEGKQEQHDAYQWLIVHVVIPDTVAASEARWRESAKDPDELKERSKGTNAKWPGKPSKTVFDRLRSDFNDGKLEGNHIAQIRLSKSQVSVDLLPVPALARTLEETADEREKSWSDLMTKIRTSILSSFDARVRQYEADIAEQEARQTLPGWNFCTFFIHKEGLARALESVGLLEDALTIYDELGLGLETVIVDLAAGRASQTATDFPPTGNEIIERILGRTSATSITGNVLHSHPSRRLFDKDYRQEIVRSAVSVFDFFCYLFDRQTALILRLAGRSSSQEQESGIRETGEDLVMLAEICWRGLSFVHNAARTLKQDLVDSNKNLSTSEVNDLVASWTFSAADFVLDRTHSSHLDLTDAGIKAPGKLANGHTTAPRKDFGFSMGADPHPSRTSSLPAKKGVPRVTEVRSEASTLSSGRISEDGVFTAPSSYAEDEVTMEIPGIAELGAYRAELVILKRKMLEELAKVKGWSAGWASIPTIDTDYEDGIESLPTTVELLTSKQSTSELTMVGSDAAELLTTSSAFNDAFESLTETAIRHYLSATHSKSAERLMGDLAILKYSEQDYTAAEAFFNHASPLYHDAGWNYLKAIAIMVRIDCLDKLERHKDALVSASSLVAQAAARRMQLDYAGRPSTRRIDTNGFTSHWNLDTLVSRSQQLMHTLTLSMLDFFLDLELPRTIGHAKDRDGFSCQIACKHIFDTALTLDEVRVRLISTTDSSQEIIVRTASSIVLQPNINTIDLYSNVTSLGQYTIQSVAFHAQKLVFVHNLAPTPSTSVLKLTQATDNDNAPPDARPTLLVYPSRNALEAELDLARTTALHRSRQVSITINSGWNDISSLDVKLKPSTAGLRIHTTDVKLDGIELRQDSSFRTGIIQLEVLAKRSVATIHVRFSLEGAKSEICIKAEVDYRTNCGDFCFLTDARMPTQLPIDAEVNDVFQADTLYSTFLIRAMDGLPMLLSSIELQGTDRFQVESPLVDTAPALVLPTLPVDFAFMIKRKGATNSTLTKADTTLELVLGCISARDAIKGTLVSNFKTDLHESSFDVYRRLLLPVMVKRYHHAFNADDFSTAMLLRETKTPSFADLGWFEVIDTLPQEEQRPLSDWLMKWHIDHQRMTLMVSAVEKAAQKQYRIAVEVPSRDYVFTVRLDDAAIAQTEHTLKVGMPFALRLTLSVSKAWSRLDSNDPRDFTYDLNVLEDTWLLGGCRRARFSVDPGLKEHVIDLVLVPLMPGLHTLPTIDIQPVMSTLQHDQSKEQPKTVTCETHLTYTGLVYQAVHDRRRTTHTCFEGDG